MKPEIPDILRRQARAWDELHRSARRELGRDLRRLGLSYGEIRQILPVPKSTLSNWCSGVALNADQLAAIRDRIPSQRGTPRDSQRKRRFEIAAIERQAAADGTRLLADPVWATGVALYWAEGAKTDRRLSMSNSDPDLLRVFVSWIKRYQDPSPAFALALNIHADNDEPGARRFWAEALSLPMAAFTKSYVKAAGTGHRKNHLAHGVCRVSLRRSTDAWIRTMTWIRVLAESMAGSESQGRC